ncbi:MAG: amidohydrolase [Rhodospirillales bacterium]|nr:amidohydrolase [Rhodospirillales bacterium]
MSSKHLGLALVALCAWSAAAKAQTVERFSIISNNEKIGFVVATSNGRTIDVDYAVDDNGRGPKHKEHLVLNEAGIPTEWAIDGTSSMGGGVHETMRFENGATEWSAQSDKGQVATPSPKLYVANDPSPYSSGLYASALLKAPGNTLDVLPAGNLRLEKLREVEVGDGADAVATDAYVLSGIDMTPEFLLLDRQGKFFAMLGRSVVMREGFEKSFTTLRDLGEQLSLERLQQVQTKIAHRYEAPIRIRNVRIFDPKTKKTADAMSVVVFRGRITTIEPDATATNPSDEVIIDGQGGTLVAGLHDMHAHNSLWSGPFYLAAGVTTTRDMGNDNTVLLDLMKRIDAGELPGPSIVPSGFLEGRSPYSAHNGFIPESISEGLRNVDWYGDRGYIQIKIYNSMNPDWVAPFAAEAKRIGMRTVGHVPAFDNPDRVLTDGYNEVTHINQLMLGWLLSPEEDTRTPLRLTGMARAATLDLNSARVRKTIDLFKNKNAGLDTTTVILERLMLSRAGTVQTGDQPYLDHAPIAYQRYRKRSFVNIKDASEDTQYQRAFDKIIQTMTLLHKEGIKMWPGTDDTTGFALHRELELYARAGIPAGEVLRIATFDCDQYMSRDQLYGSIERGKRADFFLTVGDPSKDISAVRQIRMVMKDGVIYFPREIYQALNIKPFAAPPSVTEPAKSADAGNKRSAAASAFSSTRNGFGDDEDAHELGD